FAMTSFTFPSATQETLDEITNENDKRIVSVAGYRLGEKFFLETKFNTKPGRTGVPNTPGSINMGVDTGLGQRKEGNRSYQCQNGDTGPETQFSGTISETKVSDLC
ncbi:MAG TPA: hypothetical protein VJ943_08895, partial [Desulfotignum sp.]|nr:hypothetical protein [Desulfotignum sp.]